MAATRFDTRHLKMPNGGHDFSTFVGEVLRSVPGYGEPHVWDSGSVDGCIDLYCGAQNLVVECKFIGPHSGRGQSSATRERREAIWDEWRAVRAKLAQTLISRDGKGAPSKRQYIPWSDKSKPIRKYIFATNQRLANLQKSRDLKEEIENFFSYEIANRPGYEHLSDISVEVLDWNIFEVWLSSRPFIVFRWLKQWPSGYSELSNSPSKGFRSFLSDQRLPYLSRDAWSPPFDARPPWTETSLADRLEASEIDEPAIVLIGRGGVGKTRLGLELVLRMKARGWLPIRCDGLRANIDGLRAILEESATPNKFVLFCDYLETWVNFDAFLNEIQYLNASTGHQIRIVGTCRASHRGYLPTQIMPVVVGGDSALEVAYSKAVTIHIFSDIKAATAEKLAESCRYNLALAAFLLFLISKNVTSKYEKVLYELSAEPDFESWIVKRLRLSKIGRMASVASLLSSCPLPTNKFDAVARASGADPEILKDILVGDHWIERQSPQDEIGASAVWATFHDVFCDTILTNYIAQAPDTTEAILKLLEISASCGTLTQVIISLGRVKTLDVFRNVDWPFCFLELEGKIPGTVRAYARTITTNSLLSYEQKLTLIEQCAPLRDAISQEPGLDDPLAVIVRGVHRSGSRNLERRDLLTQAVQALFDDAANRQPPTLLVIRTAFETQPDRYRGKMLEAIIENVDQLRDSNLIIDWLKDAQNRSNRVSLLKKIQNPSTIWLDTYIASMRPAHVISEWISSITGIYGSIGVLFRRWIAPYISNWLGGKGHSTSYGAILIYREWLDIARNVDTDEMIKMIEMIESDVLSWLSTKEQFNDKEAQFVYSNWLKAAGKIGGDYCIRITHLMSGYISSWMKVSDRTTSFDSRYVYEGIVASYPVSKYIVDMNQVRNWMKINENHEDLQYMFKYWIGSGLSFKEIEGVAIRIFSAIANQPEASLLLKHIVHRTDLPPGTLTAAVIWCLKFSDHDDAISRFGSLLSNPGSEILGLDRLTRASALILLKADIKSLESNMFKKAGARSILADLFLIGQRFSLAEKLGRIYFVRWIRNGNIFTALPDKSIIFDQKFLLAEALLTVLHYTEFDLTNSAQDRKDIRRFCIWVGTWAYIDWKIEALIDELTDKYGFREIWQLMIPRLE